MFAVVIAAVVQSGVSTIASEAESAKRFSHPPSRPLPAASARPLDPASPSRFVDPRRGDDQNAGSESAPWKSITHAAAHLQPGDTLILRHGVYREHAVVSSQGVADRPITIRSYPGELAIIDGGLAEFAEHPETAWEPVAGGAPGEFRSVRSFPDLGGEPDSTNVLGAFADSMVPLHGYRFLSDLRSDNQLFARLDATKTGEGDGGIYCGPGLYYDRESGRIHVRLAHTSMAFLGGDNYRGPTDPRQVRLIVAGHAGGSALTLLGASHVRIADVVVRGAREATLSIENCRRITLDGVTAFGGSSAMRVEGTRGLRAIDCAFRGIAAPWTFRGHLKYRAIESRIVAASPWSPTGFDNRDFEFAYCEFTDSVDGVFIGNVRDVWIRHSLLDNVSDDGFFLTAGSAFDGETPGGGHRFTQNLFARCLTTFAFGAGHGRQRAIGDRGRTNGSNPTGDVASQAAAGQVARQTGSGAIIARNVFDFRRPVHYQQPADESAPSVTTFGRASGDHGGPTWEPMNIYHNTFLDRETPWRAYYGSGLGSHMGGGASRRIFNNLFHVFDGHAGFVLPEEPVDLQTDGNLHSMSSDVEVAAKSDADGIADKRAFEQTETGLRRFRQSARFAASKTRYEPGWTANDRVGLARFVASPRDWRETLDVSPSPESDALDAGAAIPADWFDPLREFDKGAPDCGAVPLGAPVWRVGVRGRLTAFGSDARPLEFAAIASTSPSVSDANGDASRHFSPFAPPEPDELQERWPAAIVTGYPAFDAPMIEYAMRRAGANVALRERSWLPAAEYRRYQIVAVAGDLPRGRVEPARFRDEDLPHVKQFLHDGGTLLLMRGATALFSDPGPRKWLDELTGAPKNPARGKPDDSSAARILAPRHVWLEHLPEATDVAPSAESIADHPFSWLAARSNVPLLAPRGESLIGWPDGRSLLCVLAVGRGRIVYFGWELAASLPHGRLPSTVADEERFEAQMIILSKIVGGR